MVRWIGHPQREEEVDAVVEKLPEDVQDFVRHQVWFFFPEDWHWGAAHRFLIIPEQIPVLTEGDFVHLKMIYLSPTSLEFDEARFAHLVAHEIAHHWNGDWMFSWNGLSEQQQEERADRQAAEWGFPLPGKCSE